MRRILLLLDRRENAALLAEALGAEHEVLTGGEERLDDDFDLCVLDGPALDRLGERVRARKAREPAVLLPVLLVTSRPGVKMVTRELWRSVDELLVTPIERPELRARIEVLMRARSLSLTLRRRAEDAERATRTRDEVLAVVAHDLRNPLNLVLSSASFLRDTASGLDERQREQLRLVHRAAEQMNRLIQDLLQVSGIEAGLVSVEPQPEVVETMIGEACALLQHAAEARGIRVTCHFEPGLPRVHADRDRVLQVFGNLIGNALKFTREGGQVQVRAAREGACVHLAVADTGPGIDEEDLPHVFDRFWQAQHSRQGGAGLGLAIARGIVEAHGGEIWVESRAGEGSTFHFTLPVTDGVGPIEG